MTTNSERVPNRLVNEKSPYLLQHGNRTKRVIAKNIDITYFQRLFFLYFS